MAVSSFFKWIGYLITQLYLSIFSLHIKKEIVRIDVNNPSSKTLKLIQISDFHYSANRIFPIMLNAQLKQIIEIINASQPEYDILIVTGDFVDKDWKPIKKLCEDYFSKFLVPRCFAILGIISPKVFKKYPLSPHPGNHDLKKKAIGKENILRYLDKARFRILDNEIVPLSKTVSLLGIGPLKTPDFQPELIFTTPNIQLLKHNELNIILTHNPDACPFLIKNFPDCIDIILAGHTHGGQICFPGGKPLLPLFKHAYDLFPRLIRNWFPQSFQNHMKAVDNLDYTQGLHLLQTKTKSGSSSYMYINKGLGSHFPGRFFCPPEITFIEIHY